MADGLPEVAEDADIIGAAARLAVGADSAELLMRLLPLAEPERGETLLLVAYIAPPPIDEPALLPVAVLVLIGEILLPVPLIAAEEVMCTDAPAYEEPIPMPCADIVLALE